MWVGRFLVTIPHEVPIPTCIWFLYSVLFVNHIQRAIFDSLISSACVTCNLSALWAIDSCIFNIFILFIYFNLRIFYVGAKKCSVNCTCSVLVNTTSKALRLFGGMICIHGVHTRSSNTKFWLHFVAQRFPNFFNSRRSFGTKVFLRMIIFFF